MTLITHISFTPRREPEITYREDILCMRPLVSQPTAPPQNDRWDARCKRLWIIAIDKASFVGTNVVENFIVTFTFRLSLDVDIVAEQLLSQQSVGQQVDFGHLCT